MVDDLLDGGWQVDVGGTSQCQLTQRFLGLCAIRDVFSKGRVTVGSQDLEEGCELVGSPQSSISVFTRFKQTIWHISEATVSFLAPS